MAGVIIVGTVLTFAAFGPKTFGAGAFEMVIVTLGFLTLGFAIAALSAVIAGLLAFASLVLPGHELGRVKELIARKYRIDLIFIKPIRSLQAALRHGQRPAQEIALAINRHTPNSPGTSSTWRYKATGWRPAWQPREGAFGHETR